MRKSQLRRTGCILTILLILLWAGKLIAATVEPPKNPNSAKGCAICHYRWIDTFFVEGSGTDLVPYQSEKVAATQEMCISCHDGSVLDSRSKILHGNAHKTDVAPPADMQIPEVFPLDENGKVQCATCHTAHGVESGPGVEETIFLRISNIDSAMCRACHPDKDGGPDAGNHSLIAGEKAIPKSLKSAGAHSGSIKDQVVCETCHLAHGAPKEGYLVKGAGNSGLCLTCHTDKGMVDESGRRNDNHAINMKPRTATITEKLKKDGAKLGYDGIFTCQTCHKIHNNKPNQPKLLFINNWKAGLCLECHPDKQRLEKTKHNLGVSAVAEKNLEGETVAESGMCSACHLPHKTARKAFYRDPDTDRTTAICLSCHAMGMVAQNERLAGYSHPTGVALSERDSAADASEYRTIVLEREVLDLPLFNEMGDVDKAGKLTCSTCHDSHGGAELHGVETEKEGAPEIKYAILRKLSPEICRECHSDKFDIENSRHDFGSVFPDGNAILEEKVPESDLCRNCHHIHSKEPEGFVIWNKIITTEDGNQAYDMCIACHEQGGLASEIVAPDNSHPVNVFPTGNTRSGALPLFDGHGKLAKNGIMTCYTCHDPHHRCPVTTEGGEVITGEKGPLTRFLRIEVAPESDLCVSCHDNQATVRRTDHNLVVTAPEAKNVAGRTAYESGVCSACHLVHNNEEEDWLWAQDKGSGEGVDHVMESMCGTCHSENGPANGKIPEIASHPDTLFVSELKNDDGATPEFPVFDKTTAKIVRAGNISCPVCHNAHQWRPDAPDTTSYVGFEGDAGTSFLRGHVPDRVCKQCHGVDGLYLFTYFHKANIRKTTDEE